MEKIISVLDFLKTFNETNGEKPDYGLAYLDYRRELRRLLADNEKYPEIIHPSLDGANPRTLRNYKSGRTKPKSVLALEKLNRAGISFPLTYDCPAARPLFTVYSLSLFSGNLDANYNTRLEIKDSFLPLVKNNISPLELKLSEREYPGKSVNYYTLPVCGNSIGRVLACMGSPIGEKVSQEIDTSKLDYFVNNSERCSHLMVELVNQLLQNRAGVYPKHGMRICLPGNRTKEPANKFANSVASLLNVSFEVQDFSFNIQEELQQLSSNSHVPFYVPQMYVPRKLHYHLLRSPRIYQETRQHLRMR